MRMWNARWMVGGLAAAALLFSGESRAVGAQRTLELSEATAVYPETFALVSGVRELSDGRVMVADPLGLVLLELAPDLSRGRILGSEGQGPDEYRQPDAVWPIPGDTTLLVDLGNARLTWVAPDGSFARTRPILLEPFEPGRPLQMMIPGGVDGRGRLYFQGIGSPGPDGEPADSAPVHRLDPETGAVTEIARVKRPDMEMRTTGGADNQNVSVTPVPLSPQDGWVVAPDGRVGVVRAGDYSVEWIGGGGAIAGPPVDYQPVEIGGAEREEWAAGQSRNGGIGIGVDVENGEARVSMSRQAGPSRRQLARLPWPEHKPPFDASSVRIDRDGRVWVARSLEAGEDPLYDVFDGQGRHIASVRIPADTRLIGFGDGSVYLARYDEFDLIHLQRHAMPL